MPVGSRAIAVQTGANHTPHVWPVVLIWGSALSGFVVILRKDNRPPPVEIIASMEQALRMFGPDRSNLVEQGRFSAMWSHDIGFTPQDALEAQPVVADRRWLLVFVGYLMHREELAQRLNLAAAVAEQTSDSALVMAAWQAWGEDCLDRLYGKFSFVVCDLDRNTLFACRGPERAQCLYVHDNAERIVIATTTKPIFCDPAVPREIDEVRIADALILNYEDKARSFFKHVSMVPGGHVLRADPERFAVQRYYRLEQVPDIRFASDADYAEAARELLRDAVTSAMRATSTPAISLSAGLDSPAVAVTMLDAIAGGLVPHHAPVKAFTAVPASIWDGRARPGMAGDEAGPVRALAAAYPALAVEFIACEAQSFDHGLDQIQSYADAPVRGVGNLPWGIAMARRCRETGSRVLLSGSSGNATLSMGISDTIFARWLREMRWGKLLAEHNAAMQRASAGTVWYWRKLFGRAVVPNLPDRLYGLLQSVRGPSSVAGFESFSAINPAYAEAMNLRSRLAEFDWDDSYRKPRTRRELMRKMIERGGRDQAGAIAECTKIITGVQGRDPLGDRKLLEFCYAIPDDQFFSGGVDRRLIREVMAGRLPPAIRQAPRGDQTADWHARMTRDMPRIREELERLADDPRMAQRLDLARMRRLIDAWPAQTPVSISENPDFMLMRHGISRAIAVARFVNQAEGRN